MLKSLLGTLILLFTCFTYHPLAAANQQKGLFVTVLQEPQTLSSRKEIAKLISFSQQAGIKNIFIQVYRANKSWFASAIADQTPYLSCRESAGEDPLQLLISQAHEHGIKVYAWMNMLSLGENKNAPLLKKYGESILTTNRTRKKRLEDYKIDSQYFLEPGDTRVHKELSGIVEEVVRSYPELDGLLFDYIRYPDVEPDYGYTKENLRAFQEKTGISRPDAAMPQWQGWKRAQVNGLLDELCRKVRGLQPGMAVTATGCSSYSRAYYEAFQDWPSWLKNRTVDYVVFMSYESGLSDYRAAIAGAKEKTPDFSKVMLTVGAYKQLKSPGKFGQQLRACEDAASGGCIIFHYGSLVDAPALADEVKQ